MILRSVPDWDAYFLNLARTVATRSKDPKIQVGAVIVGEADETCSTGYNDLPRGAINTEERWKRNYQRAIHAEANAIATAAGAGRRIRGATLYTTLFPCWACAGLAINAGIARVVYDLDFLEGYRASWLSPEELSEIINLFRETGVVLHGLRESS